MHFFGLGVVNLSSFSLLWLAVGPSAPINAEIISCAHHEGMWRSGDKTHSFLTRVRDGGERSHSRLGHFTPEEKGLDIF